VPVEKRGRSNHPCAVQQKRPVIEAKRALLYKKSPIIKAEETHHRGKKSPIVQKEPNYKRQKRPIIEAKGALLLLQSPLCSPLQSGQDAQIQKASLRCTCAKRDLIYRLKRPAKSSTTRTRRTNPANQPDARISVKRDLL
jgi:hypothetical protein